MCQLSLFDYASRYRVDDPQTSREAAEDIEPKLTGLRAEFVRRLVELGQPATANEVAAGNESIRKRAKECERLGFIREIGTKQCEITGKQATVYWVE